MGDMKEKRMNEQRTDHPPLGAYVEFSSRYADRYLSLKVAIALTFVHKDRIEIGTVTVWP